MRRLLISCALAASLIAAGPASPAAASGGFQQVSLPFFWPNNSLYDVASASADSVWIVGVQGEVIVPSGRTIPGNPVVRRWKNGGWTEYPLDGLSSHATITSVDAPAPEDVWISGIRYRDDDSTEPYIGHFTGSSFAPVALPSGATSTHIQADASGTWLSTSTDIYRWTNGAWSRLTALPALRQHALQIRSADDIWLFGQDGEYSTTVEARHWDGASWTQVPVEQPTRLGTITDVLPLSATDAWAVGVDWVANTPTLLHWDGASWKYTAAPSGLNALSRIVRAPDGTLWVNGHATDQPAAPGLIRYRDGAWQRVTTPALPFRSNVLVGALAVDPTSGALWTLGTPNIGGPVLLSDR
ncbi:hypothetical protein [Actinomadura atramentaria]|uniref:hypothetical protein n=1 Tax=Actinomadura atramentaria TaxID=1990 RepID=UPI000378A413|nr:hypothetical protein [Actinomadura atramentaria]